MSESPPANELHIAVGVLERPDGQILIAQRRAGTPGAGKWEFPGGKREAGESIQQALARELQEEIGVRLQRARPMLRFAHDYSERRVSLDIWRVSEWQGEAQGREGQKITWCAPEHLQEYDLLSANKPIVDALRLPATYAISPDPGELGEQFLQRAEAAAAGGASLLRLRAWSLHDAEYEALAQTLKARLRDLGTTLLLDRDAQMVARVGAEGLHIPARELSSLSKRPVAPDQWFAASCHNREELLRAKFLGADFAVLGPVNPTQTHPGEAALGWAGFTAACEGIALPVYALGGLSKGDLEQAWQHRAQGVAGIRDFWG